MRFKGNPVIIKCSSKKREEERLTGVRTSLKMTNKPWISVKNKVNESLLAMAESCRWPEEKPDFTVCPCKVPCTAGYGVP